MLYSSIPSGHFGTKLGELLDKADEDGFHVDKLYGDSAYCDWEEIKKREGETEFCVKVGDPVNRNEMFTKDEFEIDLIEGKFTCSAENAAIFDPEKESGLPVNFGENICKDCPLRDKCTKSKMDGNYNS